MRCRIIARGDGVLHNQKGALCQVTYLAWPGCAASAAARALAGPSTAPSLLSPPRHCHHLHAARLSAAGDTRRDVHCAQMPLPALALPACLHRHRGCHCPGRLPPVPTLAAALGCHPERPRTPTSRDPARSQQLRPQHQGRRQPPPHAAGLRRDRRRQPSCATGLQAVLVLHPETDCVEVLGIPQTSQRVRQRRRWLRGPASRVQVSARIEGRVGIRPMLRCAAVAHSGAGGLGGTGRWRTPRGRATRKRPAPAWCRSPPTAPTPWPPRFQRGQQKHASALGGRGSRGQAGREATL